MPIRALPLDAITEDTVREMIARGIREDHTLDFEQELRLDDSGKLDLIGDVTAMANASGGTILYGAVEGDDDATRGVIVDVAPMLIAPDRLILDIEHLLRDNVSERLMGLQYRAIPVNGGHLFMIRIPASPLAPHLVTRRSQRDRFFLRGAVSNQPMTARQIKEVVMRSETAIGRTRARVEERNAAIVRHAELIRPDDPGDTGRVPDAVGLHFLPLYSPATPDLSD